MSSDFNESFTKENLDLYLKELAKEYKKLGGKNAPAEIILIGGAAILARYHFREMTTDVDAVMNAMSSMKDAINHVGDKFNLPNRWLNDDFKKTDSYSNKLVQYSVHYKSFYGVLSVRMISAEYLIAMKLKSCREYKKDISDIVGILAEHESSGEHISKEKIQGAIENLYGNVNAVSDKANQLLNEIFENKDYNDLYLDIMNDEDTSKQLLMNFEDSYPSVLNQDNTDQILDMLKSKLDNNVEYYKRTPQKIYEAEMIQEGLEDINEGRTVDGDEAVNNIRTRYGVFPEK